MISGSDPEDGSVPLTPFRVLTILGMGCVQVAVVCVRRLVTMVRRGTVFSDSAFRYVDGVIGAIVAAALIWSWSPRSTHPTNGTTQASR